MVILIWRTIIAIYGINVIIDSDINRDVLKEVRLKMKLLFECKALRNIDKSATATFSLRVEPLAKSIWTDCGFSSASDIQKLISLQKLVSKTESSI